MFRGPGVLSGPLHDTNLRPMLAMPGLPSGLSLTPDCAIMIFRGLARLSCHAEGQFWKHSSAFWCQRPFLLKRLIQGGCWSGRDPEIQPTPLRTCPCPSQISGWYPPTHLSCFKIAPYQLERATGFSLAGIRAEIRPRWASADCNAPGRCSKQPEMNAPEISIIPSPCLVQMGLRWLSFPGHPDHISRNLTIVGLV